MDTAACTQRASIHVREWILPMGLLQAEKLFWKHNSRATRYSETGRIRALLRPSSNRIQVVDEVPADGAPAVFYDRVVSEDRKRTRLNSSHANNSYAVFCLRKQTGI